MTGGEDHKGKKIDDLIAPKTAIIMGLQLLFPTAGAAARSRRRPLLSAQCSASKGRATVVTSSLNEDTNERFDVCSVAQ